MITERIYDVPIRISDRKLEICLPHDAVFLVTCIIESRRYKIDYISYNIVKYPKCEVFEDMSSFISKNNMSIKKKIWERKVYCSLRKRIIDNEHYKF